MVNNSRLIPRLTDDFLQLGIRNTREIMNNLSPFFTHLIGLRDPHGEAHSNQVADLAFKLGQQLDLPAEQMEKLEFAAKIHDIGKVAINDFIVTKPGRYTEAEYLMVQQHALLGSKLIVTLGLDPIIHLTILSHHENFDGTGYPYGIRGNQIPLEARIIRIADTYDALTSNRGYRPAFFQKDALEIMEQEQQHFDPRLLETFFKMVSIKQ